VIPFRVSPEPESREFASKSANEKMLEIVRAPAALSNSETGFIRVRGVSPGRTRLSIGDQAIEIEVVATRAPQDERFLPRIVAPAAGATVWGTIAIGVEWFDEDAKAPRQCSLRIGERTLEPVSVSPLKQGPTRRAVFEIEAALAKTLDLVPIVTDGAGAKIEGDPVRIRVVHPDAEQITAREAESTGETTRPERYAKSKIAIGRDPYASGGVYVSNSGGEGPVCFAMEAAKAGWYQIAIVAGSDFGGGALPTVGVYVDEERLPITNGRVVDEKWRRVVLGVPIRLAAGSHILTFAYLNDFYAERLDDRNLRIDRIEVARVADDAGAGTSVGGDSMSAMTMTSGGAMNAMPAMNAPGGAMMAAVGAAASTKRSDPFGVRDVPMRIAFSPPLRSGSFTGETEITGQCSWPSSDVSPAPDVSLVLNGGPVASQRSGVPKFIVDTALLKHGANTVQLAAASADGSTASTPTVTLNWPGPDGDAAQAREFRRLTIHEMGWDDAAKGIIKKDHDPPEQRTLAFFSNATAMLDLPTSLVGDYDVLIEARGDQFQGPPIAAVSLVVDGAATPIGDVKVSNGNWGTPRVGTVKFAAGAKRLSVTFTNDAYEEKKGDRNLFVQAIVLRQSTPSKPVAARTRATILYPAAGQAVSGQDVIIAEAWSTGMLNGAELLVDGQPTGLKTDSARRPGAIVLPLLLRDVATGEHTVALRATDNTGKPTDSEPVKIKVVAASSGQPTRYERAIHLLDRFAFGPDPDELAAILTLGEDRWLEDRLSRPSDDGEDLVAFESSVMRYPNRRSEGEVQQRAISHLLFSPNPVRARFVVWAENHFSTWIRKTEAPLKCDEHATFYGLGVSPFSDLLAASASSPAMLRYLDQDRSYAGKLNENYAREIMELHTLGVHGGYSQADVTNLASVLTGLTLARQGDGLSPGEIQTYDFRFDPLLSSPRGTTVFGLNLPDAQPPERFDRARLALEMLASHPSTATFVATKLASHYVSATPPDELVKELARVFMETDGDMREMMKAMAKHPTFWNSPERLAHPLDYAVRLCRVAKQTRPGQVQQYLQRSRFGIFDRPTPDGYPEKDADYADSNAMMQRWRFARDQANSLAALVPQAWRAELKKDQVASAIPQQIVDCLAARITGRLLGTESNGAAVELLTNAPGNREEQVREVAAFIAQTPEANLR
jgi:uncharacterized protein (DUF1800 family)